MSNRLKKIWTGPETGDPKPIIYLGGNVHDRDVITELTKFIRFYCISYFYLAVHTDHRKFLPLFEKHGIRMFLDSGAFSYQMLAMNRKRALDKKLAAPLIDQYVDYIYASPYTFDFFVTLDYARNIEATRWATERIEARGLHPVPVYHLGSSVTGLRDLIDRGYPLIGLGALVGAGPKRNAFLDQVFNLTERHRVKCHGFGVTGEVIFQYPWFSVDSSTWIMEAMRGKARYQSGVVATSKCRAVIKNEALENRYQLLLHNARYWTDLTMKSLGSKVVAKKALF